MQLWNHTLLFPVGNLGVQGRYRHHDVSIKPHWCMGYMHLAIQLDFGMHIIVGSVLLIVPHWQLSECFHLLLTIISASGIVWPQAG